MTTEVAVSSVVAGAGEWSRSPCVTINRHVI